jgi:hypothetical protein
MDPKKKTTTLPNGESCIPSADELQGLFLRAAASMERLDPAIRPKAQDGHAGGLLELDPVVPCLILPDLHARPQVLDALVETLPPIDGQDGGLTVRTALEEGLLQVVMLGDGPHSEGKSGAERWKAAYLEYLSGWKRDDAMAEEMGLAFRAMDKVARLLLDFPERFFFLKGNHDNIKNREGGGDHGFGKYAEEGAMAADWTLRFMGRDFINAYEAFERTLPLMARGGGFLACHAEPAFALTPEDALEARSRPDVVEALTWTDNNAADEVAVEQTLRAFLPDSAKPGVVFGGHRPVIERFNLRSSGLYVQIHDLKRMQGAMVWPGRPFDPLGDIIDLGA